MLRFGLLSLAIMLVLVAMPAASSAQQPGPTPRATPSDVPQVPPAPQQLPSPQAAEPGDVLWTFAQEPPFYDQRVARAIATLIDAELRASGERVFYAELRGPEILAYVDEAPAPTDQIPLLLTAAGLPDGLRQLEIVGNCRAVSTPADVPPSQTAVEVAALFQEALSELGLEIEPCTFTSRNLEEAHLLVWTQGEPVPVIPDRAEATFLALPGASAPPPGDVEPPRAGDAGLKAGREGATIPVAPALAASIALLAAGALSVRRHARRARCH